MHCLYLTALTLAGAAVPAVAQSPSSETSSPSASRPTRTRAIPTRGMAQPSLVLSFAAANFPSVTINPTQSAEILSDWNAFVRTATLPAPSPTDAFSNLISALHSVSGAARVPESVQALVAQQAQTATDPASVIAAVASAVSGQPYASAATAFAGAELARFAPDYSQLRTIVASDLGQSVAPQIPTASSSTTSNVPTASSTAGSAHATGNVAFAGGVVALAAGLVGLGLI